MIKGLQYSPILFLLIFSPFSYFVSLNFITFTFFFFLKCAAWKSGGGLSRKNCYGGGDVLPANEDGTPGGSLDFINLVNGNVRYRMDPYNANNPLTSTQYVMPALHERIRRVTNVPSPFQPASQDPAVPC